MSKFYVVGTDMNIYAWNGQAWQIVPYAAATFPVPVPPPPGNIVGPRVPTGTQPISQPAGSVVLTPASDIAGATNSNPAGTTFWLTAGTYAQKPVCTPKAGNSYVGQQGAILDSQNAVAQAFIGNASNVTIQNLVITNYTAGSQAAPIDNRSAGGTGWTLKNCEVHHNAGVGMEMGDHTTMVANFMHHNLMEAFAGGANSSVLTDNEFSFNNYTNAFDPGFECGGGKWWQASGWVCNNNWSHDNHGPGIWADNANITCEVGWNLVENNWGRGVMQEIGYSCHIHDNIIRNNFSNQEFLLAGQDDQQCCQVFISSSGGEDASHLILIENNTIVTNYNVAGPDGTAPARGSGICVFDQHRANSISGLVVVQNISIKNNTIDCTNGGRAVSFTGDANMLTRNITADNNTYKNVNRSDAFFTPSANGNFAFWQGAGFDAHGSAS